MPRLFIKGAFAFSLFCLPMLNAQNAQRSQNSQDSQNSQNSQNSENATIPADKPDNSRRNAADQPTAEDQGNSPQDREMTRNIRRELMNNDSLSTNAKNIKVITSNGRVILRGPVASQQERQTIAAMVEQVVGKGNVTNQLEPKEK